MTRASRVCGALFLTIVGFGWSVDSSALTCQGRKASAQDGVSLSEALCPIVYPVDETPSEHGYQYIFYGNAFFINDAGYLLTAAHVLSAFRNGGGQPYILLSRPQAPPVLQKATLVAADWAHDVAVLQATPNPFTGNHKVKYLALNAAGLRTGADVVALALRPAKVQNAHTFQAPVHDHFSAQVVDYQFTQEEKGAGDTELLLFNHEVLRGQSGAPVLAGDKNEVVGIVDGRWLKPTAMQIASGAENDGQQKNPSVGAAVRIHYAIALLEQHGIAWQASAESVSTARNGQDAENDREAAVPLPVSVVPAMYPPQSLFGGEVVLEAEVDAAGKLGTVKVVQGDEPFLDKAKDALQTWAFRPARLDEREVDSRAAVIFEFAQPFLPSPRQRAHTYPEPPNVEDGAAVPVYTIEPEYPVNGVAEGSVVILGIVDGEGRLTATRVIRDIEPLTGATLAAMRQWRFVPGRRAGENVESAVIVVAAFRRPALAGR